MIIFLFINYEQILLGIDANSFLRMLICQYTYKLEIGFLHEQSSAIDILVALNGRSFVQTIRTEGKKNVFNLTFF